MAQRPSARQSERNPRTSTRVGAPERQSQRSLGAESRRGKSTRSAGGGGKVLIACLAVTGLLSLVCVVLYVQRSGEKRQYEKGKREKEAIRENNINRAYEAFKQAERGGLNYVMGRDAAAQDQALFSTTRGKENIYNVIFYRRYKDVKNKEKQEEKYLDPAKVKPVGTGELLEEKEGIKINMGEAEDKTLPIVIAQKHFTQEKGDNVNMGGEILVIVRAAKE